MKKLLTSLHLMAAAILVMVVTGCEKPKTEPVVALETSLGTITLQLHPEQAPKTVALFLQHVDAGFYSNIIFHRVIPNFMAQTGGFKADFQRVEPLGTVVNESIRGLPNTVGSVAMARTSDPDSASSQFYINVVDNPSLNANGENPGYTVFGTVTQGLDIAIKITQLPRGAFASQGQRDAPNDTVTILAAKRLEPAKALVFATASSAEATH